ncbi:MAG: hypothetical protein NTW78_06270 [Campylobacterales bacterium]|nr:hypothetical protein [Campylobacterales bacterium]
MAYIISIILGLVLFTGCSNHNDSLGLNSEKQSNIKSAKTEIDAFKKSSANGSVPDMVLPPVYQNVSVFDDKKITFSAENAPFSKVMYSISELSGLNLIIDQDIDKNITITMSVNEAGLREALDVIMNLSGCYYNLNGNILHVKQFERKTFLIPYVHSNTSFTTELGGDTLNSANSGKGGSQGIKGDFKLKFDNPKEINSFYEQLEKNIASLVSSEGKYTLNRFSGTLSVYDKKVNVNAVETMINRVKKQCNQQVLIEAKILEVVLNNNHSLGISWDAVANSVLSSGDKLQLQQPLGLSGAVSGTMTYSAKNFSSVVSALNEYGDVDTLSNPSISVLSGQSAIISSGKLLPFWEKEVQITQGTGGSASTSEVTYTRRDVLNGLTMGVTPTVLDDANIMLNVIPITSSIEDVVEYTDENGKTVASAPVLNVKEAGTIIYAKNNDLVLIGGLINNAISKKEQRVPLLGDIPWLGSFFTRTVKTDEKRELVILIRIKVAE